jgi:hypothetical protein
MPKVTNNITTNNLTSTVTLNSLAEQNTLCILVYAKDSSKLDVNNPSQIIDKIAFKEKG